ncbi:Beta-1 [Phytophthora citrophthora]|uniref:Beta-1 n=1 Tax=Phytophthora citrophthora TaxID=4793 RepID=A0AAD9G656_9STRA|nr:Beta-1 [Phytophthora citrophthora]
MAEVTMHHVSEHLRDRHPYADQPFQESYNPKELANLTVLRWQVTRAFGARAIPKYAELLAMEDLPDEDRCRALQDLRELLSSPQFKFTAIMKELMFICADLTQSISAEVRQYSALVVASLVLFEMDTPNELSDEVVLSTAARLLGDDDEDVAAAGCRIFINLTVFNEGCLLLASKNEAVTTLANVLTTKPLSNVSTRIVQLVVEVLANLTRIYEGARTCAHFPILAPVLLLVKKPRLCPAETLMHAAMVITNVASYDQAKREAIQLDAVEHCLKALSKVIQGQVRCDLVEKRDELTRCLVSAVMTLSTAEDAKPRIIEFGIEPLAQCLTHSSTSVRQNAAIVINSACELPRGVTPFTQRLLHSPDLLVDVLGIAAVPALDKNVRSFDDEDTPAAVKALTWIQKKDAYGTANRIVQTLDMLDNLVKALIESEVPAETQQGVADVLRRMGQTDTSYQRRVGRSMIKNSIPDALFGQILGLTMVEFEEQLVFFFRMAPKRSFESHESSNSKKKQRRPSDDACLTANELLNSPHTSAPAPEKTTATLAPGNRDTAAMQELTRVAVLVPFRDNHPAQKRQAHLDEFVPYMTKFLQRHCASKSASFHIFILEQSLDGRKFNRGKLLNAGFDMARDDYDVYIFHDVDLLPGEELGEHYTTVPLLGPMHIARMWGRYSESDNYFGGIVAFTRQQFIKVNGFPNNFWGWGGEDNELYSRVVRKKLSVQTPASGTIQDLEELSLEDKLTVLRTGKWKCTVKRDLLKEHHRTWKKNGLKNLRFEYVDAEAINEYCTKITIKLGPNGHWSDSRSSLEHPIAPDQDLESYLVLTVSATANEVTAEGSPDGAQLNEELQSKTSGPNQCK